MVAVDSSIFDVLKSLVRQDVELDFHGRGNSLLLLYKGVSLVQAWKSDDGGTFLKINTYFFSRYAKETARLSCSGADCYVAQLVALKNKMKHQVDIESYPLPFLFVNTEHKVPTQIIFAGITGAAASKYIRFKSVGTGNHAKLYTKIFHIITRNYEKNSGKIMFFGSITGYTCWLSGEHGLKFDTTGRFQCSVEGGVLSSSISIAVV